MAAKKKTAKKARATTPPPAKDLGGRPTAMTEEVVETISRRLADGESLRAICRDKNMPAISTVMLAVVDDRDGFRNIYMRAREAAGFSHADRIVEVVQSLQDKEIDPNTAKAMMDGLKWAAERMASKTHSPRQDLSHTSPDGSMTPRPALDASKLSTKTLKEIKAAYSESDE